MDYGDLLITPGSEMHAMHGHHSNFRIENRDLPAERAQLEEMGFNINMIRKMYLVLKPRNIEEAIDYMTEIDGVMQHDFHKDTFSDL